MKTIGIIGFGRFGQFAAKHLKKYEPDYDAALELYGQARNILATSVGWEPEINNINGIIKDLQQEKANSLERKRLEQEAQIQRQQEYAKFQEELRQRRAEEESQRQEQMRKFKELVKKYFWILFFVSVYGLFVYLILNGINYI